MLKHGILGLINYTAMTGYELKEVFEDSLNYFWTAQTSQIYRELQALEKNGWAKSTLVEQSGKPDKKIFHITENGKEELLRWLAQDDVGFTMRTPLLMKVFFLGEKSVEENLNFFRGFRQMIEKYLEGLQMATGNAELYSNIIDAGQKALYWEMTLDYGKRSMKMYLDWVDECIKKLEAIKETDIRG